MNDIVGKFTGTGRIKGVLFILFAVSVIVTGMLLCMESIACTFICMTVTMTIAMLITSADEINKEQKIK